MNKIKKTISIYFIGEIFNRVLPIFLLPYLTRSLGANQFGELSLFSSYSAIFLLFISLSVPAALARYRYRYGNNGIIIIKVLGFFLSLIVFITFLIFNKLYTNNELITFALFNSILQAIFYLFLSDFQSNNLPKKYLFFQIMNGILSTLLTLFYFEFDEYNIFNRMFALNLSLSIVVLICILKTNSKFKNLKYNRLKLISIYLFFYCIPITIQTLSTVFKSNFDRLIINEIYTSDQLGVYSLASQVGMIYLVIGMTLNKAITPYLYSLVKKKELGIYFTRINLIYSFLLCILPGVISFLIPNVIWSFVFGKEFSNSGEIIPLFIIAHVPSLINFLLVIPLNYFGDAKIMSKGALYSALLYIIFLLPVTEAGILYIPLLLFLTNMFSLLYYFYNVKNIKGFNLL